MADISFNCPHCSQHFEAPPDMAGDKLPCPTCGKEITVPSPKPPLKPAPAVKAGAPAVGTAAKKEADGTTCPECQAKLAPNAALCVKCGFNLKTGRKMEVNLGGAAPAPSKPATKA